MNIRQLLYVSFVTLFLVFYGLLLPLHAASTASSPTTTVQITQPWLSSMARFIVGSTIKIQPLSSWNATGGLRSLRKPQQGTMIIALDPKDAAKYNIKNNPNLHCLYENLPVREIQRNRIPFDPSILPFLSQRMLIVVSAMEPENYAFYQRRLAEFQSRMESTLEVGRSLIGEVKILDLTGSVSPWILAAAEGAVRPPDDLWEAWMTNKRLNELTSAIGEAQRRGWWLLIDAWTPAPVRSQIMGKHRNIYIKPAESEYDFFVYLHDIYLEIWSATVRN